MRPITRSFANKLENVITSGLGCKQIQNIQKYHNRTAGMIYLFRRKVGTNEVMFVTLTTAFKVQY